MPYLKCTDPNNEDNYLVMENGKIGIWKKYDGESRLITPLTQLATMQIIEGSPATLVGRYEAEPSVFVSPKDITVFDGGANSVDQRIEITQPTVAALGDGQYSVSGHKCEVVGTALTSKFLPLDFSYKFVPSITSDTNTSGTNMTWGPVFVPNIQSASIGVSVVFVMLKEYTYYESTYFKSQTSFKVGVSATKGGAITWGTATVYTCHDGRMFTLFASVNAAGNYLWLNIQAASLSSTFIASNNMPSPFYFGLESYQFLGGQITTGDAPLVQDGAFDCVVCGR